MRLVIVCLIVLPIITEAHFPWFRRPVFDCRRIHRAHCCASRIRAACPHICMNSPCGNMPGPHSLPPPSGMGSNLPPPGPPQPSPFGFLGIPGIPPPPQPGNIFGGFGIPGLLPPPSPAPSPFGSIGVAAGPAPPPPPAGQIPGPLPSPESSNFGPTPFPTLVPETATAPAISSFIEERGLVAEKEIQIGPNGAVDGIIKAGQPQPSSGKKKNKGILKPPAMPGVSPDELVELVDYEGVEEAAGRPPPDPPAPTPPPQERFWTPVAVGVKRIDPIPEGELSSDRTTVPVREAAGEGLGSWKFAIRPSGYKAEGIEVPPSVKSVEVKVNSERTVNVVEEITVPPTPQNGNEFNNKVGELIGNFLTNNSLALGLGKPQAPLPPIPSWATGNATVIPPLPSSIPDVAPGAPVLIQTVTEPPVCGVAPDFTPCVPAQKASAKLLDCCKRRLMPPGCQELCRYDITQVEIKKAFDAGKCGILHVAPFLECASDGNNNLDCCRHRQVAKKSGPQCEVFCNPAGGLGALGLQHLACQNVIGDLLQCHHSGVRPF